MPKKAEVGSNALTGWPMCCSGGSGGAPGIAADGAGVALAEPGRWNGLVLPAPKMKALPPTLLLLPKPPAPAASVGERNELSLRMVTTFSGKHSVLT